MLNEIKGGSLEGRIFREFVDAGIVIRKAGTVRAWVDHAVETHGASMAFGLTKLMIQKALRARIPAAWCVWASQQPIGMWLTDGEWDHAKRMQMAANRRTTQRTGADMSAFAPPEDRRLKLYEWIMGLESLAG